MSLFYSHQNICSWGEAFDNQIPGGFDYQMGVAPGSVEVLKWLGHTVFSRLNAGP